MLISKFGAADIEGLLEEYEDFIGEEIPDQLRLFLEKYNGGETPNTRFQCGGVSSDLKAFYGLGKVKYSLNHVTPLNLRGSSYLPFAFDSFGNQFVMDLILGTVLFLDHESGHMTQMANDLKSFVQVCESREVKCASVKSVEEREADLIKRGRKSVITDALRDLWRAEIERHSAMMLEEVIL